MLKTMLKTISKMEKNHNKNRKNGGMEKWKKNMFKNEINDENS